MNEKQKLRSLAERTNPYDLSELMEAEQIIFAKHNTPSLRNEDPYSLTHNSNKRFMPVLRRDWKE